MEQSDTSRTERTMAANVSAAGGTVRNSTPLLEWRFEGVLPPGPEQVKWVEESLLPRSAPLVPILSLEHNIDSMSGGQSDESIRAACEVRTRGSRDSSVDSVKGEPPEQVVEKVVKEAQEGSGSREERTEDQEKPEAENTELLSLDAPSSDVAEAGEFNEAEVETLLKTPDKGTN